MKLHVKMLQTHEEFATINEWCKRHFAGTIPWEGFPPNTLIAYDDDYPVVVGSIFLTDTSICYIDNLFSNPDADAKQVSEGVKLVVESLMEAAKKLGKKHWCAVTKERAIKIWALRFNQTRAEDGYTWMTGDL